MEHKNIILDGQMEHKNYHTIRSEYQERGSSYVQSFIWILNALNI